MKKIVFCLMIMFLSKNIFAQEQKKDQIIVIGNASIEVPADIIKITINLSFSDREDGRLAFEKHKEAEKRLIEFLKDENILDSVITYSLLRISLTNDSYNNREKPNLFSTHQSASFIINDFSEYVSCILNLIDNGFTNISQNFESSKGFEAMESAIQKAVVQATHKAELMAIAAGRKINKISKISDTEDTEPMVSRYYEYWPNIMKNTTSATLTDIPQKLKIEKQVKVVFDLD